MRARCADSFGDGDDDGRTGTAGPELQMRGARDTSSATSSSSRVGQTQGLILGGRRNLLSLFEKGRVVCVTAVRSERLCGKVVFFWRVRNGLVKSEKRERRYGKQEVRQ